MKKLAGTKRAPRYRTRRVVAVDVDGTIMRAGAGCSQTIARLRQLHAGGFEMFLWSARGAEYARAVAARLQVTDLFTQFVTKPGYILDDEGWRWIRFTKRLTVEGGQET